MGFKLFGGKKPRSQEEPAEAGAAAAAAAGPGTEDFPTPEAVRPPPPVADGALPGETSPDLSKRRPSKSKSSRSSSTPPSSRGGRFRACGTFFAFLPYGSLLSLVFVAGGLVLFALKGNTAADDSLELLTFVESSDEGYASLMSAFKTCWAVTLGVAGGCVVALAVAAAIRVRQRLRKAGRCSTDTAWTRVTYKTFNLLIIVGFVFVFLCCLWFMVNLALLTGWGIGVWAVRDGSAAALASYDKFAGMTKDVNSTVDELVALATSKDAAEVPDKLMRSLATSVEKLDTLVTSWSTEDAALIPTDSLVCPSPICVNVNYWAYLESTACICSASKIQQLQDLAAASWDSNIWALAAIAALSLGALLGSIQLAVDKAMLNADQEWMRVIRRKSRSSRTGSVAYLDAGKPSNPDLGLSPSDKVYSPTLPYSVSARATSRQLA